MKKFFRMPLLLCALFVSGVFALPFVVSASEESITAFDASYFIHTDGRVDVTETITYDFGENDRQGIFRNIPYKYKARGGNFNVRFSDISVTDGSGKPLTIKETREGDDIKIRIGDKGTYITGEHVYQISYTVERVINFFGDGEDGHDEFYWNVTGDGWGVPMGRVTALVETDAGEISQIDCFQGSYGSTEACTLDSSAGSIAEFVQEGLGSGEGMTIVVGLPAGSITKPSPMQEILWFVRDNWLLGVPLLVLLEMFRRYWTLGRDPRGRGTVYARWEIPEDLNPIEAGLIIDERTQKDDLSSLFIDLAIRGFFTISQTGEKGLFTKQDYLLTKKKDWTHEEVEMHELMFLNGLFSGRDSVKISDLKNEFYKDVKKITEEVHKDAAKSGYFVKSPAKVRGSYFVAGFLTAFFSIWLGGFLANWISPVAIGAGFASGVIIVAFSFAMPKRTAKGVEAKEAIEGLKVYLEKAEKRRLDFHNNPKNLEKEPEHTVATFEKYLPYAMVLGVHEAWAEQFEGIYDGGSPEWFSGMDATNFSTSNFVNSLGSFTQVANAAAHSQPSNASGGGSGFSGGGSGGGFGGGGGGSW